MIMYRPFPYKSSAKLTVTIEIGRPDFHKMGITVLKIEAKNHSIQELQEL